MLYLDDDLLNDADPLERVAGRVGLERVVSLRHSDFEARVVNKLAGQGILQRDIALGKVWVLRRQSCHQLRRTYVRTLKPRENVIPQGHPVARTKLCPARLLPQRTALDLLVLDWRDHGEEANVTAREIHVSLEHCHVSRYCIQASSNILSALRSQQ